MKNTLRLIFLLLVSQISFVYAQNSFFTITNNEFETKVNATTNAQLIDVRTEGEFATGYIENAKNINWNGENFIVEANKLDKTKPLYVYCLSGGRSAAASQKLIDLGFKEVYNMQGGIMQWKNANKKVVLPNAEKSKGMSEKEYANFLNDERLVLIDFYAPWCGPCKKMAPYLAEMSEEKKAVLAIHKINADENEAIAKTMQIEALPTLFLYKNKKEVWKHVGYISKEDLEKIISKHQK